MSKLIQLFTRLTHIAQKGEARDVLRTDLAGAITTGHFEGAMEKADRDRLLGALDLSSRTVDEIMRHRASVQMVDADLSPADVVAQVLASPHTRLPVYRDAEENILGVIHTRDLFREVDRLMRSENAIGIEALVELDVLKLAMKPYFIPDTTPLDEQMREFQKRHTHFALVVDEYGALQGLITLEDILEEIVGEITDEFDVIHRDTRIKREADGAVQVPGQMTIRDLNRDMDWSLPDEEANTIAGLVIHEARIIPVEGQTFLFHGFRIEVMTRRENRITRLRLRASDLAIK
jgi:Mg2+/Co2+ transporter CorB